MLSLLLGHLVLLVSVSLGSASIQIYFQGIQSELPEAKVQEALPSILARLTNVSDESKINITSFKLGNLTWSSESLDTCEKVIKFIDETQNSRTLKISFREDIKAPDEITSNCPTKRDKIPNSSVAQVDSNAIETSTAVSGETSAGEQSAGDDLDATETLSGEPSAIATGCSDPEDEYCLEIEKESKRLSREFAELKDALKLVQSQLEAKDKDLQQAIANTSEANRINQRLEQKIASLEKDYKEMQDKLDEAMQAAASSQRERVSLADKLQQSEESYSSLSSQLGDMRAEMSKAEKDYADVAARLNKFEQAEAQLKEKRQLLEQQSSGVKLNNEQPSYGKYIGLGIGFLIVVAYLVCARSYSKHGMYELHTS